MSQLLIKGNVIVACYANQLGRYIQRHSKVKKNEPGLNLKLDITEFGRWGEEHKSLLLKPLR